MVEIIDVVLPVRDEAECIAYTLESIHAQELDGRYEFHVSVMPNACTDATSAVARATIKRLTAAMPRPGLKYEVTDRAEPGKIATLNAALAASKTKLFMYADGDVTFSSNAFLAVADKLHEDGAIISGPVHHDVIAEDTEPQLAKLLRISCLLQDVNETYGRVRGGAGGLMAFRRSLLDEIPVTAYAENLYIFMMALKCHGMQALRVAAEASVYPISPRIVTDHMARELRIEANNNAVLALDPEFKKLFDEFFREYPQSVEDINNLLLPLLDTIEVTQAELDAWHAMQAKIANAPDIKELLRPDGTWVPIESTKRPLDHAGAPLLNLNVLSGSKI